MKKHSQGCIESSNQPFNVHNNYSLPYRVDLLIIGVMKTKSDYRTSQKPSVHTIPEPEDVTRVSVAEARRIMGKASDNMSDEMVQKAIYDLTAISRAYIRLSSKMI